MRVVVVYDIAVGTRAGARRLNRVAKLCLDRGVRVQASVFECDVNAEQFRQLKQELAQLIDAEKDSVRFYLLGNHYQSRIECLGRAAVLWDRETYVL